MAYDKEKTLKVIFKNIEEGMSLRQALLIDGMPNRNTFFSWIDKDQEKSNQYARVCEARAETIFEDILRIADDQEDDVYTDENGIVVTNHNVIQRARLRVDSRKWMLGKMMPKKYGDRLETENTHSGKIEIVRTVIK